MRKKWKRAVAWMIAGGVLLTSFSTPYEAKAQVRQDDSYTVGEDFFYGRSINNSVRCIYRRCVYRRYIYGGCHHRGLRKPGYR